MAEVGYTRNLFLRGICVIYLFAFISLYLQIPGLYGNNGILPARTHLQDSSSRTLSERVNKKPTLLWFAPYLGLNTEYMMDVLCLIGIIFSFSGFVSQKFCIVAIFAALWSLYYSLYQVGQTFMWFQWDILLLEVGFLSMLVAPWKSELNSKQKQLLSSPSDSVTFFLIRWLFFRFMFASGVVKLQSGCPTWWGLTALNVHFESQPLPTILAWYLHHLPTWFLKLGTVYTHIVEQIMPFLFFFPMRSVRITGFFLQLFLQLCIIVSGNYNFFNFLTILLAMSLLDDQCFFSKKKGKQPFSGKLLDVGVNLLVHGFILYIAAVYFSVRPTTKWTVESEIAFTKADFDQFVKRAVPAGMYLGGVWLLVISAQAVLNSFRGFPTKFTTVLITLLYVSAAFFLFGISLVPYSALHKSSNSTIMPPLRKLYGRMEHLQIANSYGLFRRMTGVGGRPEVIIEGSNDLKGPWIEYHFKYKPGDVNSSMPYVGGCPCRAPNGESNHLHIKSEINYFPAPHQPRLDWQMWFAALGTYHQNPWLMSTAYRILQGEKSVIELLDSQRLPFSKPPKYLKASLYHYHYTPWSQRKLPTWWKREPAGEYFPIFTKDHTPLTDYLKTVKILDSKESLEADNRLVVPWAKVLLDGFRNSIGRVDPVLILWSVFSAGCAIISTTACFYSSNGPSSHKKKA